MLCLTGRGSRTVSGCPSRLGGGTSASLAEACETHEEDVPGAHEGKPPTLPRGGPRPIHWWVHTQVEGALLSPVSSVAWEGWNEIPVSFCDILNSVEQVIKQVG